MNIRERIKQAREKALGSSAEPDVRIRAEQTPNPASLRFIVNHPLIQSGTLETHQPVQDEHPILAKVLLGIDGVESLFFCQNWVAVTKQDRVEWNREFQTEVGRHLRDWLAGGGEPLEPQESSTDSHDDEVTSRILDILNRVIRPQVQQDGGDIVFAGFSGGAVSLYMRGSCSGCPSAMATLKHGVERLLKESIPEVQEVSAIE